MRFLAFALFLLSSLATAAPTIPLSLDAAKYCATSRQGDAFTGVATGACPVVVPPASVANQLRVSAVSYGPYVLTARPNVNVTEWDNIWGHSNLTDAVTPWPGGSGAAPVIRAFNRNVVLCAHFRTTATFNPGFFTYGRNWSGPDLTLYGVDISISKVPCDFTPNGGSTKLNALPTDDVMMSYRQDRGRPADAAAYSVLAPNTDYYLNIQAHIRTGPTFPLYVERN